LYIQLLVAMQIFSWSSSSKFRKRDGGKLKQKGIIFIT